MSRPISAGTVYLVGAGPGDPGLITVRGLAVLRTADVVIYDRLVHPDLLFEAGPSAELVDVGKAPGRHTFSQEEINEILIRKAKDGEIVVRLKGGDPFVFGRGGEECRALAASRIPFEVVPGVSSAVAVPAFAGIPVTHRGVASGFTVVTGHGCSQAEEDLDWDSLARVGTLVVLMGVKRLPEITARLIAHGRSPETAVAVIQEGATTRQKVVAGTLEDIVDKSRAVESPATIVIGPVVELRGELDWFRPDSDAHSSEAGALPETSTYM